MEIRSMLRRIYKFLWKEDSLQSYLAFIIISYLLLKFIVYPGFLWVMGWKDIVAVLTSSMVHTGNINQTHYNWLKQRNIDYQDFPFPNGLYPGDAVVVVDSNDYEVGEVIVYVPQGYTQSIIHRIVYKQDYNGTEYYITKGDANSGIGSFEINLTKDQIIGKAIFSIPLIGYPRKIMHTLLGI